VLTTIALWTTQLAVRLLTSSLKPYYLGLGLISRTGKCIWDYDVLIYRNTP